MNGMEFHRWWAEYSDHFPQTAEWVSSRPARLLELWAGALEPIALEDALEATDRIFNGRAEKPKAYEREDTPSFIMLAVKQIRAEQCEEADRSQRRREAASYRKRGISSFPAGMLFSEYRRARRKIGDKGGLGLSEADAKRHIQKTLDKHLEAQA